MNKELFASMREQMCPSAQARAALEEKLVNTKSIRFPVRRYAAIAACAAVIAAAVPVYNFIRDSREISIDGGPGWQDLLDHFDTAVSVEEPHSYTLLDDPNACWPEDTTAAGTGDSGDEDQDMTPGELRDNMLEAGFTQEDADAYLASGWQMTWAKWWKFYHQSEESGGRTLDALLDFSREEMLAVNTGEVTDLPGGAYIGGPPDQSGAITAYQNLMAKFEADYGPDRYPEWYGGAYIDEHAGLIVNIADGYEPEGKELFFQIQDWAGSDRIGFGSSRESLNYLRFLQEKVLTAMDSLGIQAGCGINEESGLVELDLPYVTDEILWELARLDPTNAVLVRAGYYAEDTSTAPVSPSVSAAVQPGGGEANPALVEDAIAFDD